MASDHVHIGFMKCKEASGSSGLLVNKPAFGYSHFQSTHLPAAVSQAGVGLRKVTCEDCTPMQHQNQMSDELLLIKDSSFTMERGIAKYGKTVR